jgi:hypothetical protein
VHPININPRYRGGVFIRKAVLNHVDRLRINPVFIVIDDRDFDLFGFFSPTNIAVPGASPVFPARCVAIFCMSFPSCPSYQLRNEFIVMIPMSLAAPKGSVSCFVCLLRRSGYRFNELKHFGFDVKQIGSIIIAYQFQRAPLLKRMPWRWIKF